MTFVRGLHQKTHKDVPPDLTKDEKFRLERTTVITPTEFQDMLDQANQIKDKFSRLRSLALLCLFRLTGKRRTEMAMLEIEGFKVENGFLHITFTLLKKRKTAVLSKQAIKSIPLTDPLTTPIIEYLEFLKRLKPIPKYFFPSTRSLWGRGLVIFSQEHLRGRQIFNIVRATSETVWPHLFRETVASDVVKSDPTLIGAFKVQRRLDLEDMRTGFNYLRRFAGDIIDRQLEAQGLAS